MDRSELQNITNAVLQEINSALSETTPVIDDVLSSNEVLWSELLATYRKLKIAKPNDRSSSDRHFAICITEYEKLLSYFHTMILSEFEG